MRAHVHAPHTDRGRLVYLVVAHLVELKRGLAEDREHVVLDRVFDRIDCRAIKLRRVRDELPHTVYAPLQLADTAFDLFCTELRCLELLRGFLRCHRALDCLVHATGKSSSIAAGSFAPSARWWCLDAM